MGFFGGGGASVDLASPSAIGSTTPNTGAFTTLSASGSASIGTTANYQCLNIAQATSNPSNLPFISLTNHGPATIYAKGGYFSFNSQNFGIHIVGNTASVRFGTTEGAASDVVILRENATGVLAQRAGTNAQTFRLYNTFTDASNYERGFLSWTSNTFRIGTEKAGTGSQRNLEIYTDGTLRMYVTNNAVRLTNNAYLTLGTGGVLPEGGGASNYLLFRNNSGTELGRFQGNGIFSFTGTTSSFPALKPSSAVLQVRLADDSGYTVLDAQLRAQGTAPATAGATGTAGDIRYDADYIYICTATNTWKRVAIATWP